MATRVYNLEPMDVPKIKTGYRTIQTRIPVPESVPIIEQLARYEPVSMTGQPPIVWDRADGFQVRDRWGNMWIDWSSGVLVANAGHGRKEIIDAVKAQAEHGLLHNYCFPSEIRAKLAERLAGLAPEGLDKVFILTTGSEATECAIKLARMHGKSIGGNRKIGIVSFEHAFHGRTLGAQMIGGIPALKEWIVNLDPAMIQAPFPDGFRCPNTGFDGFLAALDEQGVRPDMIAGVITETYQGGGASFAPEEYMRELAAWCKEHDIVLIMDEIQAGFGRTGRYFFGFEHYGIVPDMICCGKGISSSLPVSCVIGRPELMDRPGPRSMTSTHTGNPICVAAALANIDIVVSENLPARAEKTGAVFHAELARITDKYRRVIGAHHGKGLVAGLHMVKPGGIDPDPDLAFDIVERCYRRGLLMFAPVGYQGATVKMAPPLTIAEDAVREGAQALDEAIGELAG